MRQYFLVVLLLLTLSCVTTGTVSEQASSEYIICTEEDAKYQERSAELQTIVDADQADREGGAMKPGSALRDRERRQRVGQIFGEGCFKSAKDYSNAALVFQHGDQSDHYLQTFLWSKRSVALGDQSQMRMMALSIDRYLLSKGHKQLFASQASKDNSSPCWCLQRVEDTFPSKMRQQYMKATLADQIKWVDDLNSGMGCQSPNFCSVELNDSPKGTAPGFW